MSGFDYRMAKASAWESELTSALVACGWQAEPFGQALIPQYMRDAIRSWRDAEGNPTLMRWMPDIIAAKKADGFLALIDAKSDISESRNYAVEKKAVDAGLAIISMWGTPVYYVWRDGGVLTPESVLANHFKFHTGSYTNGGSGTPFYLIEKCLAKRDTSPFTDVLNRVTAA